MKRFMTGEWKVRVCGVLLAVTMAAGMTACGSKSGDNGSTQGTVQAQTTEFLRTAVSWERAIPSLL